MFDSSPEDREIVTHRRVVSLAEHKQLAFADVRSTKGFSYEDRRRRSDDRLAAPRDEVIGIDF
jgi:hypothetical protein